MPLWIEIAVDTLVPLILAGVVKVIVDMASLRSEMDDIKNNHLNHIYTRLQSIDEYLRKQF